ncbi:hypothetical protein GYMLUDRAFT_183321 [Collybiopsis luxurians FD-317 M1]|uniref:Uncharacterized protein n=1 Tax=Collybiopsis luxurians FD-317 M1 TaxID=944289 RepID=A0A0D0C5F6_9AGAR|nr:hypothetical protein GYMLUDRAFT_183321 [Collybiopsis luxurians FD-317 M1]
MPWTSSVVFSKSQQGLLDLADLLCEGNIALRHIPESEIMDRSKGDALAKTLVLIQTTWFIAQVISRAVLHLPITELEFTTAAFALLNFLTYALWWKKPLDVRHPILLLPPGVSFSGVFQPANDALSSIGSFLPEYGLTHSAEEVKITRLSGSGQSSLLSLRYEYVKSVPLFYAGPRREVYLEQGFYLHSVVSEMLIGILFGSIHCAAWAFHFPSELERDLWRIMSLCITIAPLAMIIGLIPFFTNRYAYLTWNTHLIFVVYILARLTVFIMAFVLLRDLPEGAFQEIQWTTYIPHV